MQKKKLLCRTVACAGAVCLMTSCGSKAPDPPENYTLGEDHVQSLNAVLGEENSGKLTEMETPETAAEASSSSLGIDAETCLYTYEKLDTGGETVRQYVEKLTGEENGFQVVDENGAVTDPPDYSATEGSVALAKTASEDGKVLRMDISWTATDCQITLTRPEGTVGTADAEPMTYVDAVDFIKSLSPATLGLKGSSMADYSVYPMDGAVLVDGILCLKLQAYPPHEETQANVIGGTYLLSGDKAHLYLLQDDKVRELSI